MNSKDFYKLGDNRQVASGILGAFWNRVFPENGLTDVVKDTSARSFFITEVLMREMPEWLTGTRDGALRIDRLEIVPVDKVVPIQITGEDNLLMNSGAYMGAPSPRLKWELPLSASYREIPVIVPLGKEPLLCGIDYTFVNDKIFLRANPSSLGIDPEMENVDGIPAASWKFLLASAVPQSEETKSNFDFYSLPESSRRTLIDMLAQEGSKDRILRFLESCIGIKAPTKFELSDTEGYYTTLEASWTEEGTWYGVTTAGEIISAPEGWGLENGFSATGNIIRPSDPLVHGISVKQKISDSDSYGVGAEKAFIPNEDIDNIPDETLDFGHVSPFGVYNPDGSFNTKVEDSLDKQNISVESLFPTTITGNLITYFYSNSKRQEPSVISMDSKMAEALAKCPNALIAVRDSVPAGSLYVINTNLEQSDEVTIDIEDECEAFVVTNVSDSVNLSITATQAVPRKSAL